MGTFQSLRIPGFRQFIERRLRGLGRELRPKSKKHGFVVAALGSCNGLGIQEKNHENIFAHVCLFCCLGAVNGLFKRTQESSGRHVDCASGFLFSFDPIRVAFIYASCYYRGMIAGFRDADTERLWSTGRCRRLPAKLSRQGLKRLYILHAALALENLNVPPGNRLEKLHGDREGQHSIRINDQYRVCFVWRDGNAHEVEIVDYH